MANPIDRSRQPYVPAQQGIREVSTQGDRRTAAAARERIPSGQTPVSVHLTANAAAHQSAPLQPVTTTVTEIANGRIVKRIVTTTHNLPADAFARRPFTR